MDGGAYSDGGDGYSGDGDGSDGGDVSDTGGFRYYGDVDDGGVW